MTETRKPYDLPLTPAENDEVQALAKIIDSPEGQRRIKAYAKRELGGVIQFPRLLP
jgi:hypothetical protein